MSQVLGGSQWKVRLRDRGKEGLGPKKKILFPLVKLRGLVLNDAGFCFYFHALDARCGESVCERKQGDDRVAFAPPGFKPIASARVERDPQANHGKTAQIAT